MDERNSIVVEEYLQEIFLLQSGDAPVKAIHLASRLQTSPSTVHATLSRMQRDNLIEVDKKRNIFLTENGTEQAKDLVTRHNLAENFLCKVLGIPWYQVHKHAHKLEHAMTPLVVEKLAEFLGHPDYCPHGVPIHGYHSDSFEDTFTLEECETGMKLKIMMIDESLEESEDLLKYLHDKSIVPGKEHVVLERMEATQSITLQIDETHAALPFDIAKKIIVSKI